jgi:putative DNA-invertase from lambdoid prophage Rac
MASKHYSESGYARVSKEELTVENQLLEIETAGFRIEQRGVVVETISGSVAMNQRPGFTRLLEKLDADDVLVVTKLDRLGRNAIDVVSTVVRLAEIGVRALPGAGRRRSDEFRRQTHNGCADDGCGVRTRSVDRTHASWSEESPSAGKEARPTPGRCRSSRRRKFVCSGTRARLASPRSPSA